MAKTEGAEAIMSAAEMKPLLLLAKRLPVGCALALTKDKEGILLLDKKVSGRKLGMLLKAAAAEAKLDLDMGSLRFGQATVGEDDGTVHFAVNKEAPSALRPKLVLHLKKAGFSKCEITVDGGLDTHGEATGTPLPEASAGVAAQPGAVPKPDAAGMPQPEASAGEAPQPGAAPKPDAAALTARLTGLVKRMASNAALPGADAMAAAARAAQAAIKSGDLTTAAQKADELERLLGASTPSAHPSAATFNKAGAAWVATRKKVAGDVEKLQAAVAAHYEGHAAATSIPEAFRARVGPMLDRFDHALSDKLEAVGKASDPSALQGLVAEVHKTVADYQAMLAADQTLRQLDENPFVPLAIRTTLAASLAAVAKAVQASAAR